MTRQEAIELLKLDRDMANFNPITGEKMPMNEYNAKSVEALDMAIEALEQEPKRGVWIKKEHLVPLARDADPLEWDKYDEKTHSELEEYWHCSECDYEGDRNFRPLWKYCPNCGAKMWGDKQ